MKKILYTITLVALSHTCFAQLTVTGQFRPRLEVFDGYEYLPSEHSKTDAYISQRSRLNIDYKNEKITTSLSFQDVRYWGETGTTTNDKTISLNEAWVKINLGKKWDLKIGRQAISIDNQRLFGLRNWNQIAQKHDALTFNYNYNNLEISIISAYNQNTKHSATNSELGTEYNSVAGYKNMETFWLKKKWENFWLGTIHVVDGQQDTTEHNHQYYRYTSGLMIGIDNGNNKVSIRGFYQTGKHYISQKLNNLNAFNLCANYNAKLNKNWNLNLGLEYTSGDDTKTKEYEGFDALYGNIETFNGYLGYFQQQKQYSHHGFIDATLQLQFKPNTRTQYNATYHYFASQQDIYDGTKKLDNKYLGSELDLYAKINFSPIIALDLGYCMMFGNNNLNIIQGGGHKNYGNYGYIQLDITPVFYKSPKKLLPGDDGL